MRSEEQLRQLLGQLIFFLQHRYDVYTYMYDTMYVRYSYELNINEKYIYGEKKTPNNFVIVFLYMVYMK